MSKLSYYIVVVLFALEELQCWHMDASVEDIKTIDGETVEGLGEGFSAFIGLSDKNSIWVADFNRTDNSITGAERIEFSAGDCIILKYGTVHRGDCNTTLPRMPRYKTFTDVNTGKAPDNKSQLWILEGEGGGYSIKKPQ